MPEEIINKLSCDNPLIYVLLDLDFISKKGLDIFALTDKLVLCDIDIFQLRIKNINNVDFIRIAKRISSTIQLKKKMLLINDHAEIAKIVNANGLHLGKNDISVKNARTILGKNKIIGKTVHSLEELRLFQEEEVNYISAGPAFKTGIKPDLSPLSEEELKKIRDEAKKPLFIIGGIKESNINYLTKLGIKNIAVCEEIISSINPQEKTRRLKQCLQKNS